MNPTLNSAGAPFIERSGMPPPLMFGGGTRQSALLADSFGAANFQSFLDQAGILAKPIEQPEEAPPAPRSPKPLPEERPLPLFQPGELPEVAELFAPGEEEILPDPGQELGMLPAETGKLSTPKEEKLPTAADDPAVESPVILWNSAVALDPRVAIQALKQGELSEGSKGGNTPTLEQMLAQVRGAQQGQGTFQSAFAADSLVQTPAREEIDPAMMMELTQTPPEPPLDEAALQQMLQEPALPSAQGTGSPQPVSSNLGQPPNPTGWVAPVNGAQFSQGNTPEGSGNQGMGGWGGSANQSGAITGKSHGTGQNTPTLAANSPQFADELAGRVGRMRLISRPGQSDQVKITLDPKDLGEINLRLHLDGENRVHLSISAESEAAKELLNRQMPQLKEALAKQNLGFGEVMVEVNTQEKHASGGDFAQQQERGGSPWSGYQAGEAEEADLLPGERVIYSSNSAGLNIIA